MKLELKHLAPYLPYGLKVVWADYEQPKQGFLLTLGNLKDHLDQGRYRIKPILRPLSDLTKEIEVDGKKFTPLEIVLSISVDEEDALKIHGTIPDYWKHFTAIDPKHWDYWIVQMFLEWHFDIFGLIPAGLAIDINTLDK